MPPKSKKKDGDEIDPSMRAARFGRVKNTLTMGFGTYDPERPMLADDAHSQYLQSVSRMWESPP